MLEKSENYNYIKEKIHAIKEEFPCLKNRTDEFAFSALAVKAFYYKNPALNLNDNDVNEIIVDGQYDGGVDFLLSDPNSETSDLVIGQSKFYTDIKIDDVINAVNKMFSFYKDMKEGHYETVNEKVQSKFMTLNAEVGEESKIHFIFVTSANQNGIRKDRITKKIKDYFPDDTNMEIIVYFADDLIESIKELESRRPTVESGKIAIDKSDNYLSYGEDEEAVIVNVSAYSLKQLYAQHNTNILARNLRYHVPGRTIDKGITETIDKNPEDFWYKNNGITIICDDFNVDGKEVKLRNFSIVNGGQTTYMIHKNKNVSEYDDFYLPCKIIKTVGENEDEKIKFSLEIAKATNSQKAIKAIDLKANAPEQVSFSRVMREVGIFYQTKRGENVPNDFKLPYLNTDLAEVGKLCLSAIFQMPGTSRNKPSTLYTSPYYENIFESHQKQIANIVKELLYIDNYWKKDFKKKYELEVADNPNYSELIAFANNSRTICIAFAMFAGRYYSKNFTANEIGTIFKGNQKESNKKEFINVCENLGDMNFVLPNNLFEDKPKYEQLLHDLFVLIINYGFSTFRIYQKSGDGGNATNYLKKDESYYNILDSSWNLIENMLIRIIQEI